MDISDALTLANDIMDEHGLTAAGWKLRLSNAATRHGSCSYKTKTIRLSRQSIELRDEKAVRDTIVHEVAHALLPAGVRHGHEWKKLVSSLGGTPKSSAPLRPAATTAPVTPLPAGTRVRTTGPKNITGTIIRVNRTRYRVSGDDGRIWVVPFAIAEAA